MSVATRAGFTLVEVCIALTMLALIALNVQLLARSGRAAASSSAILSSLENELELTLDRVAFALMAAEEDEIEGPIAAPLWSDFVRFTTLLGEDASGDPVRSATEEVAWISHRETGGAAARSGGRIQWREDVDTGSGRRITWSNDVPDLQAGEVGGNALDDNGNDLLDEGGLAFTREGERIRVFVTIERADDGGAPRPVNRSLTITPRN